MGVARFDFTENLFNGTHWAGCREMTKLPDRRGLSVCARRTQIRNIYRLLKREAAGNDLSKESLDRIIRKWSLIFSSETFNNLRFPFGSVERSGRHPFTCTLNIRNL